MIFGFWGIPLGIPCQQFRDIQNILRRFYGELLGCKMGRTSDKWQDFDFFGHQVVAHCCMSPDQRSDGPANPVDGHMVPVPHFGVVLPWDVFHSVAAKIEASDVKFEIKPYIRFEGLPGEQATMFFKDPSGNALEFKSFKDMNQLFATQ